MSGVHPMVVSFLDVEPYPHVKVVIALNTVVWPHTTDPQDPGAAQCVRAVGWDMADQQLNVPTSGPVSITLPFTSGGPKSVSIYASTDRTDPLDTSIDETTFTITGLIPGQL